MQPEKAKQAVRKVVDFDEGTGDAVAEGLGGAGLVSVGIFLLLQALTYNQLAQALIGLAVVFLGIVFYAVRRHYRDLDRQP